MVTLPVIGHQPASGRARLGTESKAPSTLPGCLRKILVSTRGSQLPPRAASRKPRGEVRKRANPLLAGHGPGILTDSHQWGYDGDQERSQEHVHEAVEARQPPGARVAQAQHVGVTVVQLDVSVLGILCTECRAYLEEGAGQGTGSVAGTVKPSQPQKHPPSPDAAFPGPACPTPPS